MSKAKRTGIIIGVMLLLAAVAAVWLGRPAYRHYKENRALVQARADVAKGDYRGAILSLNQTLMLNPANAEAVHIKAELFSAAQSPAAMTWRRRAIELSPTFENKVLLIATGLRVEAPPFPITIQTLEELRQGGAETNAAYHFVASQLAIRQHRAGDAERHLEALIHFDPTNRQHQLNLAIVRLQTKDPRSAEAARRELNLMADDPALRPHALRALIVDATSDRRFDEADRLAVQLLAMPQALFEDRLQRLEMLQLAQSRQMGAWLAEVKRLASTNILQIATTASWLNGNGLATNALAWLDSLPAATMATPPLPAVKADGYVAVRDWLGLEQFLTKQRWDDQEFLRLALLSRALREQNRREMAGAQWSRALGAAGSRIESLTALAQMATRWGWALEADDVLWAVARRAPWLDWAWLGLVHTRQTAGDTAGLYRVYNAELESKPDSLPAKNNVAIIGLLLNVDLEKVTKLAGEVYQAQPTNVVFASTYAFALHRHGQSAEGLKLMQTMPEAELLRPDIAAYQAILLSAVGQRTQAEPFFVSAERGTLLPEERRLVAEAMAPK